MVTVLVKLTNEEAYALAHALRNFFPEAFGVDAGPWYAALDKILPQLA